LITVEAGRDVVQDCLEVANVRRGVLVVMVGRDLTVVVVSTGETGMDCKVGNAGADRRVIVWSGCDTAKIEGDIWGALMADCCA